MSQYYRIHPDNPQPRLIKHAVDILERGGLLVYPTDSTYALGCRLGDKSALARICALRQLDKKHHFTLLCKDLADIATYAQVSNSDFRLLKACTPGPYTFILKATNEVPRQLLHPKQKTIGLRVPDHPIMQSLMQEYRKPLLTTTLLLPGEDLPMTDPEEIRQRLEKQVDLIIDGGYGGVVLTTVVSLLDGELQLVREGCGELSTLGL